MKPKKILCQKEASESTISSKFELLKENWQIPIFSIKFLRVNLKKSDKNPFFP